MMLLIFVSVVLHYVAARDRYIIGGNEVTENGRWPWQGSLKASGGSHTCGCVLVHESWVLTAAHCISGTRYFAEFGMLELGTGLTYELISAAIHPNFEDPSTPGAYPNDIAVLESGAIIGGPYIQPIDLTLGADLSPNPDCWITGWGRLAAGESLPTMMHEVNLPIINNATCKALWGSSFNADIHVCAWDQATQDKGHCNGDNGGPLACLQGGIWRLEGIASWFMSGCNPAWPFAFTRVEAMQNFICDATVGVVAPGHCTIQEYNY